MATHEPVNGTYGNQEYGAAWGYPTGNPNNNAGQSAAPKDVSNQAGKASANEIPKDEVGWYFVEQYYTTLSRNPENLYLFYNKRSQFVAGNEEEKVPVCIGKESIKDRIKELEYNDCKVRVTNVDSQGSDEHIVIQVIGEISNKGQPHKRFAQTFILAEQLNGYFVLNDIFRYLAEDPEEEEEHLDTTAGSTGVQEPAPTAAVPEAEPLKQNSEVATSEEDLTKVDNKLKEAVQKESTPAKEASPPPAAVNGTPVPETAEIVEAEEAPVAAVSSVEEVSDKENVEPTVEEPLATEKPKEPAPTPAAAATPKAAPATATPSAPPKPTAPRTWASLAASANKVATPNVPAPVTPQAPSQPKAATPAQTQPLAVPAAQTSTPAREPSPANSQGEAAGWQTAGSGHKKEQSRAQNQGPADESEGKRAYIKNVYSQVEETSLRNVLSKFGEIVYLDISRQKNCAFVDFKNATGFQNAVNNNPHTVNGIDIKVEERRLRPGSFAGPNQRNSFRGGRGGSMGGQARGNFQSRGGRGGSIGRGGRPAAQEA